MAIKYYVTNQSKKTYKVFVEQRNICQRESNLLKITPGTVRDNFYTSENNIFCSNTYGTWRFKSYESSNDGRRRPSSYAYFEVLDNIPGSPGVDITIKPSGQLRVSGQVQDVRYTDDV